MADYSLRVFSSQIATFNRGIFVEDITNKAIAWQRSTRLHGGFWQGNFTLTGTTKYLLNWLYKYLGYHVEERSGGFISWEGLIYEMTLSVRGVSRRRSLDDMWNSATARVRDPETDVIVTTVVYNQPLSIARYGRKEDIVPIDGFDITSAQQYLSTYISAYGYPRVVGISGGAAFDDSGEAVLDVNVRGYIHTANWQYVGDSADETTGNVSDWIGDIIVADCPYLSKGRVMQNTTQVLRKLDTDTRAYNQLQFLTSLGDDADNFYKIYVGSRRVINYVTIDLTHEYYLKGGQIFDKLGTQMQLSNQWRVRPGIWRDLDYPIQTPEYGSLLSDGRDMMVDEVIVGARSGIAFRATDIDEAEREAIQYEYAQWIAEGALAEEEISQEDTSAARKRSGKSSKMMYGVPYDRWIKLKPAQRRAARAKYANQ